MLPLLARILLATLALTSATGTYHSTLSVTAGKGTLIKAAPQTVTLVEKSQDLGVADSRVIQLSAEHATNDNLKHQGIMHHTLPGLMYGISFTTTSNATDDSNSTDDAYTYTAATGDDNATTMDDDYVSSSNTTTNTTNDDAYTYIYTATTGDDNVTTYDDDSSNSTDDLSSDDSTDDSTDGSSSDTDDENNVISSFSALLYMLYAIAAIFVLIGLFFFIDACIQYSTHAIAEYDGNEEEREPLIEI